MQRINWKSKELEHQLGSQDNDLGQWLSNPLVLHSPVEFIFLEKTGGWASHLVTQ